ncbi:PTS sugar transporter subunit IIA [Liquorilactobacillus satsumensis]|uniref:PTS sugar transporter subunit IIA n=1 Tax=Liquorilactobacillus satsumensis TaxID=259059 RepID=UPI0021C31931|nr:PTS sugar transporter subunit IIA [Liquorilactobacillus satsumensis]MCP9328503.1 PTS sugar transporter subunit IIA [Liquorilactobacillus satsumensis]
MADVFNRKYIFLEKELPDQQAVFRFIAKQAVALQLAKKEQLVLKALEKREAEMSTGMQDGIAIPHAISSDIQQAAVLFVRTTKPVSEWETFDNTQVKQIIAMLVPADSTQAHLQILANFATTLIDENQRQALTDCQTAAEVYTFLTKEINANID